MESVIQLLRPLPGENVEDCWIGDESKEDDKGQKDAELKLHLSG